MNKWQTPYTPNHRIHPCTDRAVTLAVVSPGETLWGISLHYRPDADPREIVWLIQEASGCTALIRPGQVLLIPMKGEVPYESH